MYISQETSEQTDERMRQVIRQSDLTVYDEAYSFEEFSLSEYVFNSSALAVVRDEEVWSHLVQAKSKDGKDLFRVFCFHFKVGLDNSGFVGWLATRIKKEAGTGVFVVCGHNRKRGGIFDCWGCPISLADKVLSLIQELRKSEKVTVG